MEKQTTRPGDDFMGVRTLATENVRKFRKAKDLKQEDFGELFGLSVVTVSRLERGKTWPSLSLANRFQCEGVCNVVDWLTPLAVRPVEASCD